VPLDYSKCVWYAKVTMLGVGLAVAPSLEECPEPHTPEAVVAVSQATTGATVFTTMA
jgi:hypothetical protein